MRRIEKQRHEDYCNIRFEFLQSESTLNDTLMSFLVTQKAKINYISSKHFEITRKIHVCIYPSSEQYTFNFSVELLRLLSELNLEIGITVLQL